MTPQEILNRPIDQRRREFQYRFGQAVVFGLPVVALQYFGYQLGGTPTEAQRWISVLQALLAGWVMYVAASGMVIEGVMTLPRRATADLLVGAASILVYLHGFIATTGVLVIGQPFYAPTLFHLSVGAMIVWCGWRWWSLRGGSNLGPDL